MTDSIRTIQFHGKLSTEPFESHANVFKRGLKAEQAYEIQASARDGEAQVQSLNAKDVTGKLVVLEFEDGKKLWVRGERLLERLSVDQARQSRGAGITPVGRPIALKAGQVALPVTWQTASAARGAARKLLLKGLSIFGFDVNSPLAKGMRDGGVKFLENQLVKGTIGESVDTTGSGWLFPVEKDWKLDPARQIKQANELSANEPYLLFLHGTASSSSGSFGKLAGKDEWEALQAAYRNRILAFEHRSLSASPVQNVLDLIQLLPDGARLHLVSHSRGGLLGELLCLSQAKFSDDTKLEEWLAAFDQETNDGADKPTRAAEKKRLAELWSLLAKKRLRVERFVRVACPARGTTWLADNVAGRVDDLLAALLFSMQFVDGLTDDLTADFIESLLAAPLELRQKLPGLEAMIPSSPLIRCLNHPRLATEAALTVIKGDSNIGLSLWSLGTIFANAALREPSDLIVNTQAMDGGLKRAQPVWQFLDEGSDVTHFSYFANADSRSRLFTALTASSASGSEPLKGFSPPSPLIDRAARGATVARVKVKPSEARGTVFVIPGIMGSELQVGDKDIWLNYFALWRGAMADLKLTDAPRAVQPKRVMASEYDQLIEELERTYRVEPFPYDWRLSVAAAGERLAKQVQVALNGSDKPVYLLAHSMGGLVARSMMAANAQLWQDFCQRQGRLVMLGTPNQGAPAIAAMLLGHEKLVRQLALLDFKHNQAELLAILRDFPGVMDLLPDEYLDDAGWQELQELARAPLGTLRKGAVAQRQALEKAIDPARMIYVAGAADRTPLRLRLTNGELEIIETNQGDGRVPYAKYGLLAGVPTYYANVVHGSMANEPKIFPAIQDLLEQGKTDRLPQQPRTERGEPAREFITRTRELATVLPTEAELRESLMGGVAPLPPLTNEPAYTLQLSVMHGHLRHANFPLAVGHYVGDSIVSAEAHLDRALGKPLSARHGVGLYPGPVGTAEVVYVGEQNMPPGALVIGLGDVGEVTTDGVRQGIAAAALRYALWLADRPLAAGETGYRSAAFSSLLIGTYAGRALSVVETVEAIVAGAITANRQLQAQGLWERVRVDQVEIVELYEDVAVQAMQAVHRLRRQPLNDFGEQVSIEVMPRLLKAESGGRYHRPVSFSGSQWWRRIQIVNVNNQHGQEHAATNTSQSFPDVLRHLSAHPALRDTQRQIVAKLVEDAATMPAQREYLTELINHLLTRDQVAPTDDWLEFTVLTERARAEGQQQVSQRFWIDKLIEESVADTNYQAGLAATLFELLVPNDLKRQAEDVLLIVDRAAAQYPWELLADRSQPDKPVVTQIGLLRQFKSLDFRVNPVRARGRNAFIVGDSAGHLFGELPGAQLEAQQVAAALETAQYQTTPLIKESGLKIVTEMFAREYQIMHIAAHGTFDVGDAKRQGIVLGDNQYLTTTELVKLRAVPDLVFINCCHLGKLDKPTLANTHPHRLAASIAEELIKLGVKAVIAAGWAVDDLAALTFANEFYREMLNGERFGDAVRKARQRTHQRHKDRNTWGAYQCYGSTEFVLPNVASASWANDDAQFYSRREFRDELKSIAEQPEANDPTSNARLIKRVAKIAATLPDELADGEMLAELANAWSKLGDFKQARDAYQKAIGNKDGRAALRSLEQSVNMVCRVIDKAWYDAEATASSAPTANQEHAKALKDALAALARLQQIGGSTDERQSLTARIYKSQALLARNPTACRKALQKACDLYRAASENSAKDGKQRRDNYPTYNWLACEYLLGVTVKPAGKAAKADKAKSAIDFERLLKACEKVAEAKLKEKEDFWVRVALPDAELLRALIQGTLVNKKELLVATYQEAFRNGARPHEVDSALSQIDFLRVMIERLIGKPDVVRALREIRETLTKGLS